MRNISLNTSLGDHKHDTRRNGHPAFASSQSVPALLPAGAAEDLEEVARETLAGRAFALTSYESRRHVQPGLELWDGTKATKPGRALGYQEA